MAPRTHPGEWVLPLVRSSAKVTPMSVNESFLATALAHGKIRPTPGHLWCEKLASVSSVDVDGLGSVSVSEVTSSGLVLVSDRTEEADTVLGNLLVVRAVGEDPHLPQGWHTYHLGREVSWPLGTWEGQCIEVGTVIAIRAVAGVNQGRDRRYVQVRYDEIAAIGAPLDEPEDAPAMYPGPGWVLVRLDTPKDDTFGSVYVGEGRRDVFENGGVHWGTVYSLPRGFSEPFLGVSIGSRVAVPRWQSTEYLELEGGIRAVPWGDVLAVEE